MPPLDISSRVSARFGRGKNYIAIIDSTHPKFRFNRQFLKTVPAGDKLNCYETFFTIEAVPHGKVIEICTGNYKGKSETVRGEWTAEGIVPMSDLQIIGLLTRKGQ